MGDPDHVGATETSNDARRGNTGVIGYAPVEALVRADMDQIWIGIAATPVLACLSYVNSTPGMLQVHAPQNLIVLVPSFWVSQWVGIAFVPALFWAWCWPMMRGQRTVPERSHILMLVALVLSMSNVAFSGGLPHYHGVVAVSVCCWVAVFAFAVAAWASPSRINFMVFHAVLFGWLAWYALPNIWVVCQP